MSMSTRKLTVNPVVFSFDTTCYMTAVSCILALIAAHLNQMQPCEPGCLLATGQLIESTWDAGNLHDHVGLLFKHYHNA